MAGSPRIDELRKKFDENPRRYFAPLANEYRKMGDYEQAIFICQEFLPQQPGHMSGHIVYGQALFEAGRHDEARAVFETALGLDPENLIALRHLGDIALARGDSTTARSWYQRVLDADPRNEEIAGVLQSIDAPAAEPAAPEAAGAAAPPPAEAAPVEIGEPMVEENVSESFIERSTEAIPPESKIPDFAALVAEVRGERTPTPPKAEIELEPPVGGAHGDELGKVAALDGLETTSVGPAESPPAAPTESFDFDALFRTAEEPAASPPSPTPSAAPTPQTAPAPAAEAPHPAAPSAPQATPPAAPAPAGADFASAAFDLSDASPFPAAPATGAFATETMAELFLRQGHREQALGVYRQLLAARPNDPTLRAKVRELEEPVAAAPAPPTPAGPTIREFLTALATRSPLSWSPAESHGDANTGGGSGTNGATAAQNAAVVQREAPPETTGMDSSTIGGSLDALFGGAAHPESGGASPLELAFADEAPRGEGRASGAQSAPPGSGDIAGRPAQPAESELSLDHVFRRPTPATGAPRQSSFSFDQFFSQQVQENADTAAGEPAGDKPPEGDDIQQFNAWLEGLKKS